MSPLRRLASINATVGFEKLATVTKKLPIRVAREHDLHEPRVVVIDPHISYGRPVLVGTGIPTAVVAERYKAGESIDELAEDYSRSRKEIEEAIRCELWLDAA